MTRSVDQSAEPQALSLPKSRLGELVVALQSDGYSVIAPTVQQEAIVYAPIDAVDELPIGWRDDQAPGKYRLVAHDDDDRHFGFAVGPQSWKSYLYPPRLTVASADRTDQGWQFSGGETEPPKQAFLGVRACELAAIAIQDRVFTAGPFVDRAYQGRREKLFIVAVNCTTAASTCFCTSMDTGPRCERGFDLALTEVDDQFVVEVGSQLGSNLVEGLDLSPADRPTLDAADKYRQTAVDKIERQLPTEGLRDALLDHLEHSHWDDVAARCLSCGNCTMVCPTCFCSTVSEVTDLTGDHVDRVRQWDSCFNVDFSYTAGGTVHTETRNRYRQWLTHKLASWHDQFDSSGCTGCGRCITWCPVGIDLTAEVAAIRESPSDKRSLPVLPSDEGVACAVPGPES